MTVSADCLDFYFDVCPVCRRDITDDVMNVSEEGIEPGHYIMICPDCGNKYEAIFTYSLMTYPASPCVDFIC